MQRFAERSMQHDEEAETQVVLSNFKILWQGIDNSTGNYERSKKEKNAEEEMGGQLGDYGKCGLEIT